MGVSAALIYPATLALLSPPSPTRASGPPRSASGPAVTGLAVALGPVSGGLLLEHFSWGSVFLGQRAARRGRAASPAGGCCPRSATPRPAGSTRSAPSAPIAGIGLLVWTTIEAPAHGWASADDHRRLRSRRPLALAAFVGWELRRPDPLLDVRLFTNPRFSAASGAIALAFFGLFGFIFLITQYFQVVRGYDTLHGRASRPCRSRW